MSSSINNEFNSRPGIIFEQTRNDFPGNGGHNNGETGAVVKIAADSQHSPSKTLGHEILHFMLGKYQSQRTTTNNLHHALDGLMTNPPSNLSIKEVKQLIISVSKAPKKNTVSNVERSHGEY